MRDFVRLQSWRRLSEHGGCAEQVAKSFDDFAGACSASRLARTGLLDASMVGLNPQPGGEREGPKAIAARLLARAVLESNDCM